MTKQIRPGIPRHLGILIGVIAAILSLAPSPRPRMPSRPPIPRPNIPAPPPAPPPARVENPPPPSVDRTPRNPRPRYLYYNNYYGPRPAIIAGYNPRVRVLLAPRLDWSYALPMENLSLLPRVIAAGHDSTQTTYQLWVPTTYRHAVPHPLILWISAKPIPDEHIVWDPVCRKYGALFAAAYAGGNEAHPATRMRLALDVLDDIRRRMAVDTDRIYIGGFSEGGRTACDLAYAYPEFVGGVIAVGGASSLRQEAWLRDRARERLSVALVTGQLDIVRREMEVLRFPVLRDSEVRVRLWTLPRMGHAMPPAELLEAVYLWLEAARPARRLLGAKYPTMRMAEGVVPAAEVWARGMLEEAQVRIRDKKTRDSGLMLLEGIIRRWKTTAAAVQAEKLLAEHDGGGKGNWKEVYDRRQQEFYHREAVALDNYLDGPLPPRDLLHKKALVEASIRLWEAVEKHGEETREGRQAARRLEQLRKQVR